MKKLTAFAVPLVKIAAACAALFATGCVSEHKIKASAGWAEKYYSQPNTAEIINAEGTNITWTITGCNKLVFSAPVPPKSIIPRDPTWTESFFDFAKTAMPYLFMGWAVHDGAFGGGSSSSTTSTVNNYGAGAP